LLNPAFSSGCQIYGGTWSSGPLTTATGVITTDPLYAEREFELRCDGVTDPPGTAYQRMRVLPAIRES
jgi:hypothetical protein